MFGDELLRTFDLRFGYSLDDIAESASSVRKVPLPTLRRIKPSRSIIERAVRTAVRLVFNCIARSRSFGSLAARDDAPVLHAFEERAVDRRGRRFFICGNDGERLQHSAAVLACPGVVRPTSGSNG